MRKVEYRQTKLHYWIFSSILNSDTIAQILLKEDPKKNWTQSYNQSLQIKWPYAVAKYIRAQLVIVRDKSIQCKNKHPTLNCETVG